ncbi:uncharacterized protein [Periplaneta americana]|uniref:uncharacterized protein isoform X7 n=1 Tax=Periplaneta americana TaxID=6978 RepID=UPI0037E73F2F
MDVVEVDLHSREESVTRPASSYNAKDSPPTVKCEVEDTAGHCSPSSIGGFVQVLLPTMKREAEDGKGTMKEENDSLWTDAKHTSPALCMSENEFQVDQEIVADVVPGFAYRCHMTGGAAQIPRSCRGFYSGLRQTRGV